MRTIVIGGGASGTVASIYAKRNNNDVVVLEKNNKCLKKLLITGNGKCNYFNDDFSIGHYYSSDIDILSSIINDVNKKMVLDFISSIGVVARIKNGYYYPYSNQSYSVYNSLLKEASLRGINIIYDCKVLDVVKNGDSFTVSTSLGDFSCDKLVISTGGKSYPKTGSEGDGYFLGKNLGHKIFPVFPGLVGLVCNDSCIKSLKGVRCDACVSLFSDSFIKSEVGELQFTDYGLSGICIFNLSNLVSKFKKCSVCVNFLYNFDVLNYNSFCSFFDNISSHVSNRSITDLLEGYLNYNVVNVILRKCSINPDLSWNDLDEKKKKLLFNNLISFRFDIVGTKGFDCAQVCLGGISLSDIDIKTFESKVVPGLYFTGEVIDVTGDCGGYNLGFAFLSGMIAGRSIGDLCD